MQTVVAADTPIGTPDIKLASTQEPESDVALQVEPTQVPTPLEQVKATTQLVPTAIPMPPDQPVASLKLATRPCHQVGDLIWVHRVDTGEVRSSPAVVEGVVYVSAIDGHVYALEADTGKRIWRSDSLGYGGYRSNDATTAADGIVYTGSNSGYVAALDMTTGELLWSYETGERWDRPRAVVSDGMLFVGSGDKYLDAVDGSTGNLLWRYETGGAVESLPDVANDIVYAGSLDGQLYALDMASGELKWRYNTEGPIRYSSPAVAGGVVYIGSLDHYLYALEAATGRLLWRYKTGGEIDTSPTVGNGFVYVGSNDKHIYALDASDGELVWRYESYYEAMSSPTIAGEVVYFGAGYSLLAVDASTGEVLWDDHTGLYVDTKPVVADGIVHLGGRAYAASVLNDQDNPHVARVAPIAKFPENDGLQPGDLLWKYEIGGYLGETPIIGGDAMVHGLTAVGLSTRDVLWSCPLVGWSIFSVTVSDEAIYFATDEDYFYALDLLTGRQLWRHQLQVFEAYQLIPTVVGGVVFVGSSYGRLYALRASSGEVLWEFQADRHSGRNNAIKTSSFSDGAIYLGLEDHYVYALDAATGQLLWSYDAGNPIPYPTMVSNGIVYAGTYFDLLALDAVSGRLLWQRPAKAGYLLVADGIVYSQAEDYSFRDGKLEYGDLHGHLIAMDARSGEHLWDYDPGPWIAEWLTASDGVVYVGSMDGVMSAIDQQTGTTLWKFETEGKVEDSVLNPTTREYEWKLVPAWVTDPVVVGGVVYFVSRDTNLYAVEGRTGQLVFSFAIGHEIWGKPRVVDGVVYVGVTDGYVYAVVSARSQERK